MSYLVISSTKKPQIVSVHNGWASYTTPWFSDWALDDFKAAVPWQDRKWDGNTKTWSARVEHLDALKEFAGTFGPVEVKES